MTVNILVYDSAYQNKIIVKMDICPEMQCYLPSRQFCFFVNNTFLSQEKIVMLKKICCFPAVISKMAVIKQHF